MNTITGSPAAVSTVTARVVSPFQPQGQKSETTSMAPVADTCILSGSTAAAATEKPKSVTGVARLVTMSMLGIAAVGALAGTATPAFAQQAGWGQSQSQPVQQQNTQGGWGQSAPRPVTPAPVPLNTGGWGQSTTLPQTTSPTTTVNPNGGWGQNNPTQNYVSVQYGALAPVLSRVVMTQYQNYAQYGNWQQADQALEHNLQMIKDGPTSTPAEKAMAEAGLKMGTRQDNSYKNSVLARAAVTQAIADRSQGSLGQVLGRASLDAYNRIMDASNLDGRQVPDADYALEAGLRGVVNHGSPQDAAVAQMGIDMGNHQGIQYVNSMKARAAAASELAQPSSYNVGNRLAKAAHNAFASANRWDDAHSITNDGLRTIANNPMSSTTQKVVANGMLQAGGWGSDEQLARTGDAGLQQLLNVP